MTLDDLRDYARDYGIAVERGRNGRWRVCDEEGPMLHPEDFPDETSALWFVFGWVERQGGR